MLKVLLPFAVGVAIALFGTLPLWFLAGAFAVCGCCAIGWRSATWTAALLVVTGMGATALRTPQISVPRGVATTYELTIDEIAAAHPHYTTFDATLSAWRNPQSGAWAASDTRVRIYADSLVELQAGDRIRCHGTIRPFGGSAAYRSLMYRRGFGGTLSLRANRLLEQQASRTQSFHRQAVERLQRLTIAAPQRGIVEAMVVGERSHLDPTTRQRFAQSGFSHLLAVSGLHTGIVFLLINLLLWGLPLLRHGQIIRNGCVVGILWIYVAVVGFPPSAVRAAIMCSMLQTALASSSEYDGINAWATAAFGMLLWNPLWIADIGFQLSFVAVFAILAWGVPLGRALRTRHRWLNAAIKAYLICIVATAATAPLVSHTFGFVSWAGMLLSPLAVGVAMVTVGGGVLWVALPVGWLTAPTAYTLDTAATLLHSMATAVASQPWGILPERIGGGTVGIIYLVFAAMTALLWCRDPKKAVHLPS